jgi:hypothetical protein
MRTMSTGTMVGRDGKRYPATHERGGTLPEPERAEAIRLTHLYRCAMGLQYREIVAILATEHQIRRSIGTVYSDCREFTCEACRDDVPAGAHVTEAASGAW